MAVMAQGSTEDSGRIYASALVYSGNFMLQTETSEFGAVRISAGINPFNFSWQLQSGNSFSSPELLTVYSDSGLRKMSSIWHNFIRDKVSPLNFKNAPRPSYLNTWEAAYFDVDATKVINLAKQAKQLDLDMLVLDDGWFQGRNNAKSSLGDWYADTNKFPNGIEAVAKAVANMGLKFGLWFEPEMVNADSDYTANIQNG